MKARILIADDEPSIVMALEFLFRQQGYDVDAVSDGGAVIERTLASRPDLVVLDVMLPNRSGFDLCRDLRADSRTATLRIVMLTAKGQRAEADAGLASQSSGSGAFRSAPLHALHSVWGSMPRWIPVRSLPCAVSWRRPNRYPMSWALGSQYFAGSSRRGFARRISSRFGALRGQWRFSRTPIPITASRSTARWNCRDCSLQRMAWASG
jgi:CheY-like chemotaxis protein